MKVYVLIYLKSEKVDDEVFCFPFSGFLFPNGKILDLPDTPQAPVQIDDKAIPVYV